MKTFFALLLLISIVFPVYLFLSTIKDFAHNQYSMRFKRLEQTAPDPDMPLIEGMTPPDVQFGLTKIELSKLDKNVSASYSVAVRESYSLGHGYNKLCIESLGLDALLFLASLIGLNGLRTPKENKR
jgi:hypothetical protein